MEKQKAKKMVFTRLDEQDICALQTAAKNMKDMKPSRLIRIIILDWLDKFAHKNN